MEKYMIYFAYGSNMSSQRIEERLQRDVSKDRKLGILTGYELTFNKFMKKTGAVAANLSETEGITTMGILCEVTEEDLEILDKAEGAPKVYHRELVKVWVPRENRFVEAVTYICTNNSYLKEGLNPTREYMQHLLAGKDLLPSNYYQWLLTIETQETINKIEGQIGNLSGKER